MVISFTAQSAKRLKALAAYARQESSASAGFTLVELLVTVTLLGIVAALSLPQLNGIYERQKLTNAANEIVTDLKSMQNKALANNQDRYAVPGPIGPLIDCTGTYPMVNGYEFEVNQYGDAYTLNFDFKDRNNPNTINCAQGTAKIATEILPSGVHFRTVDRLKSVRYQTVSGQILLNSNQSLSELRLELINDRVNPSTLAYCVFISQGRVYAEKTKCS